MVLGQRISIVGTSGAGKTTVAAMAARRLGIPHIELDALRQGPNWTETPDEEFRRQVAACTAEPNWVIDGNYAVVRDLVWDRATAIVWIDPPHPLIMTQVVWRSLLRAITGQELRNGNKEEVRNWMDPGHPIRWAFSTHKARQAKFLATMGPKWIRLRSRKAIHHWLTTLSTGGSSRLDKPHPRRQTIPPNHAAPCNRNPLSESSQFRHLLHSAHAGKNAFGKTQAAQFSFADVQE